MRNYHENNEQIKKKIESIERLLCAITVCLSVSLSLCDLFAKANILQTYTNDMMSILVHRTSNANAGNARTERNALALGAFRFLKNVKKPHKLDIKYRPKYTCIAA